ncbi:hypothetical protein [uncultured Ruminococcus sp.]|nr:hypothetical protein [uncultured Ruminococcus sp.]
MDNMIMLVGCTGLATGCRLAFFSAHVRRSVSAAWKGISHEVRS